MPFRNFREVVWLNEKRLEAKGTVTVREGLPFTGFSGSSGKSGHIFASGKFPKMQTGLMERFAVERLCGNCKGPWLKSGQKLGVFFEL